MNTRVITLVSAALGLAAVGAAAQTTTTDFSNGDDGWFGPNGFFNGTTIEPVGGNGGAFMRTDFEDLGITIQNTSNPAFIGDYTTAQQVTISMDLRVEAITDAGGPTQSPWLLELRDFDGAQDGFAWNSVWFVLDQVSADANSGWTTYSVTFDPNSVGLPDGWAGSGSFDPSGQPGLPTGVAFADVLSGVDAIAFTNQQPGVDIPLTQYTIGVDNLSITRVVPAPSALALLVAGGLVGTRRRR